MDGALGGVVSWHNVVLQEGYKKGLNTLEALRKLFVTNPLERCMPGNLDVFT